MSATGSERPGLAVGIIGCGLIGNKRAQALGPRDRVVAAADPMEERAVALVSEHGGQACAGIADVIEHRPDVVIVATNHDQLAALAEAALRAGTYVLVEKPAGLGTAQIRRLIEISEAAGRQVKVGFNHRFHPALSDLAAEVHSKAYGELMHVRGRYGHGGRTGYDREWRAKPQHSGGGELIDQGMHLLDLTHWLAGSLPLHSALLRTHFWDTVVEDNAALILGAPSGRQAPWAMLHVTWTEWKNLFSLEVYCRTAKLQVDGLVGSYGSQTLKIFRMSPGLGPPEVEERTYGAEDQSWSLEWEHFANALRSDGSLLGSLADAEYAWTIVEEAYARSGDYAPMRGSVAV